MSEDKSSTESLRHHLEVEQKVIHLMLSSRQCLSELLEGGFTADFFDESHRELVASIYDEYLSSDYKRLLTRETFRHYLLSHNKKSEVVHLLGVFDKCYLKAFANDDDLGYLKRLLVEGYVARNIGKYLDQFRKDAKKGYQFAARQLVDNVQLALRITDSQKLTLASLNDFKDEYVTKLKHLKENPQKIVRCGIPEIDSAINVGFRPQHLTLFVGDVGGHKTNTMLNVALSIYENGYNVLMIPLEMPRDDITNRIIANRAGIDATKLGIPDMLSEDDFKKIEECKVWLENKSRFCILDANERTSVEDLRHEIDKHITVFRPDVVVIDYADLLRINVGRNSIRSFEIGEMLKNLRFMGKKYNFHIITAAQMNRAAIKGLREGKEESLDSTAVHGSHSYSADSDTIFGLMKVPDDPHKIKLHTIKARFGPSGNTSELRVDPQHCRVLSMDETTTLTDPNQLETDLNEDVLSAIQQEDELPDLDFASDIDLDGQSDEISGMGV